MANHFGTHGNISLMIPYVRLEQHSRDIYVHVECEKSSINSFLIGLSLSFSIILKLFSKLVFTISFFESCFHFSTSYVIYHIHKSYYKMKSLVNQKEHNRQMVLNIEIQAS